MVLRKIPLVCIHCQKEDFLESEAVNEKIDTFCDHIKECQARCREKGLPVPNPHGIQHATFLKGVEFYCERCDNAIVHSDNPKTGRFFFASGSVRSETRNFPPVGPEHLGPDIRQVFWALCRDCDDDSVAHYTSIETPVATAAPPAEFSADGGIPVVEMAELVSGPTVYVDREQAAERKIEADENRKWQTPGFK